MEKSVFHLNQLLICCFGNLDVSPNLLKLL